MTNPNEQLAEHFTLKEFTCSSSHPEIYNVPPPSVVENLRRVCLWLEKMRDIYNTLYGNGGDLPVKISSGYRSEKLNRAVGGAKESNHLTGCAADIVCRDCEQAIQYASLLIDCFDAEEEQFDEIIVEKKFNHFWVHFAVREKGRNRGIVSVIDKR